MPNKRDVIYSVSGGRNANTFVKRNGKLIAGFKERSDALFFAEYKAEREGGSTVEDQTG